MLVLFTRVPGRSSQQRVSVASCSAPGQLFLLLIHFMHGPAAAMRIHRKGVGQMPVCVCLGTLGAGIHRPTRGHSDMRSARFPRSSVHKLGSGFCSKVCLLGVKDMSRVRRSRLWPISESVDLQARFGQERDLDRLAKNAAVASLALF